MALDGVKVDKDELDETKELIENLNKRVKHISIL